MPSLIHKLDAILYPNHSAHWDDAWFREMILRHIEPGSHVLDLGAGAGIVLEMNFRGQAARVCGVDPDPRVMHNPYLDEARVGIGEAIPYDSGTFDLVFADNVLEHLERPDTVFYEMYRVLKPGGLLLVKTPNKWHYVPTIARLTPHAFHQLVNRLRGRKSADTFPTHYRANTPAAIKRLAENCGLQIVELQLVEGRPEYLRIFWPTYLLGWLYERTVNLVPGLWRFRVVLGAVLQKPGSAISNLNPAEKRAKQNQPIVPCEDGPRERSRANAA